MFLSYLSKCLMSCSVLIVSYQITWTAETWPWQARHRKMHQLIIMLNNRSSSFNIRTKFEKHFRYISSDWYIGFGYFVLISLQLGCKIAESICVTRLYLLGDFGRPKANQIIREVRKTVNSAKN